MWTITQPDKGDIDAQLNSALILKSGQVVYALSAVERASIHQLYARYDDLAGEPHADLLPVALAACQQAMHDAYGQVQKGGRLKALRGRLLSGVKECPLCGFAPATTLDHHLPKATYRALAIYPRNLVPCCQPCNREKGTLEAIAGAGMIHAYFQELPDDVFLHADVNYDAGVLVVTFRIDHAAMPGVLLDRLRFQFEHLDLNARYFDIINTFLFSMKPAMQMFLGQPNQVEGLRTFFLRSAESYSNDFGPNHWRPALMRGLADSNAFLANPQAYLQRPLAAI